MNPLLLRLRPKIFFLRPFASAGLPKSAVCTDVGRGPGTIMTVDTVKTVTGTAKPKQRPPLQYTEWPRIYRKSVLHPLPLIKYTFA